MERDKLDFGSGRIDRLFRAMFFPTLVGMLFNSVLNLCDGMFVGHGVGSNALAAINIVAPLFLVCTGVIFMVPGFVLLPRLFGVPGLWLAIPVSEFLTLTVIAALYLLSRNRTGRA